ncbi:MAG: hypothetical protein Q8M31_21535 [Beijerinckiaceae bacterium]|nr:hypothetical protein [Beijerinckiaceae bacterium]
MTIRDRIWWWLGFSALCLIAFWAGLAGFWTAQRDPPLRIESRLLTPEVPPGGGVRVEHTAYRSDACQLTVERAIIDADRVLFRIEDTLYFAGRTPAGESDSFVEDTAVPLAARPGPARLRETLIHVCNPIHRLWPVTQRLPDIPFVVTERAE